MTSTSNDQTLPQTPQECLEVAQQLKKQGNELFQQKEYKKAISKYNRIFLYIEGLNKSFLNVFSENSSGMRSPSDLKSTDPIKQQVNELRVQARCNLAICFLKVDNYDKALKNAQEALKTDPENTKALFRRSLAWMGKKDLDRAKDDLETLLKKEPENKLFQQEMKKLQGEYEKHNKKEKALFSKVFAKMSE